MKTIQMIYTLAALVTSVAVGTGRAATLPLEVREQLEKQQAALKTVFLEVEEATMRKNREITSSHTAYFEEDRFRIRSPSDVSFDGEMLWLVSTHPKNRSSQIVLRKTQIRNTTEKRPSFNDLYWRFPYFEAAGIYPPHYPANVTVPRPLKMAALHFIENDETLAIESKDKHLRVRFSVDDWVLLNCREIDPNILKKRLSGALMSEDQILSELDSFKDLRARTPKRTVSMLLDPQHGYLPIEREDRSADGELIARYRVEEWKYFQEIGIWLPAKCVASYFTNPYDLKTFSTNPVQQIRMTLKNAEFTARNMEFVLINAPEYRRAGTEIWDETVSHTIDGVPSAVMLTMAADGRTLQQGIAVAKGSIGKRKLWLLIALLVLTVPPILFLLHRIRFKGR